MALGTEVDLGPGDIVLDGDLLLQKKGSGHSRPPVLAHVCCDQNAGWIKIPLGTELGLGPGHIVLHGDPALPWKGAQHRLGH